MPVLCVYVPFRVPVLEGMLSAAARSRFGWLGPLVCVALQLLLHAVPPLVFLTKSFLGSVHLLGILCGQGSVLCTGSLFAFVTP